MNIQNENAPLDLESDEPYVTPQDVRSKKIRRAMLMCQLRDSVSRQSGQQTTSLTLLAAQLPSPALSICARATFDHVIEKELLDGEWD